MSPYKLTIVAITLGIASLGASLRFPLTTGSIARPGGGQVAIPVCKPSVPDCPVGGH